MPKIRYKTFRFRENTLAMIQQCNTIIAEYRSQGYDLTLRQLYYQCVSRNLLPNSQRSYNQLGGVVNDGRLAGLIDWDAIVDRTRGVESVNTWGSPREIVAACGRQFMLDKWAKQPYHVEVWIEKEALAGVFERICNELRVPYLSCRGYTSQSEMWRAGRRLKGVRERDGQTPLILHFGDHDPSGIDMSRDIRVRVQMFAEGPVEFKRLALNMEQVEEYQPPPNPAKMSDSRADDYVDAYGDESWELDALDPTVLLGLVRTAVEEVLDQDAWDEATEEEDEHRRLIGVVADQWDEITEGK